MSRRATRDRGARPADYVSTRGRAPKVGFEEALLAGLAPDGGLYVPAAWPRFAAAEFRSMAGAPYAAVATAVMRPFLGDSIDGPDFAAMVDESYAGFGHRAVAPLRQLGPNEWLLELFHGPTLAFKDHALQLLGRLFDHVLSRRGARVTLVVATSGDTGSAAIEACRDRPSIDLFVLHPKGRISEVQRRQMTTVEASNVHNLAIEGAFDDCQDLVKAMFADEPFRRRHRLSAVNSINWARIMAQAAFYVAAGVALGAPARPVSFCVPSGNFGNVFAGYVARRIGLPVDRLIVATNRNDVLARFFATGEMTAEPVAPSLSPSMDIQVASNFERLLFDMLGRDGAAVARAMTAFRRRGRLRAPADRLAEARQAFDAGRLDDEATRAVIAEVYRATGTILDPHTAVGVGVGRARRGASSVPLVCLATAHPAKFPDAVEASIGRRPALPDRFADLFDRRERMTVLANDLDAVRAFVRDRAAAGAP